VVFDDDDRSGSRAESELADLFVTEPGSQGPVGVEIDRVADRTDMAVHEQRVDRLAVKTAGGHGGPDERPTTLVLAARRVVDVVDPVVHRVRYDRVGWIGGRES